MRYYNISIQILFDILELGFTSISERPKCEICGNEAKFHNFKYNQTCCSERCISKLRSINSKKGKINRINKIESGIMNRSITEIVLKKSRAKSKILTDIIKTHTEEELFNRLVSLDPHPGEKDRIKRDKENNFIIPGWISLDKSIVSSDGFIHISPRNLKKVYFRSLSTPQILYDILVLGLIDINERPKCYACGKPAEFKGGIGYYSTCGNRDCLKIFRSDSGKKNPRFNGKFSDEQLKKISDGVHRHILSNPDFANNHKHPWGKYGKVYSNKMGVEIKYDSTWEKDFICFCDTCNDVVSITRANVSIEYIENEKHRAYIPDFDIILSNGLKYLIEIKPLYLVKNDENTKLKLEAGKNYIINNNINNYTKYVILTEKELYKNTKKKVLRTDIMDQFN